MAKNTYLAKQQYGLLVERDGEKCSNCHSSKDELLKTRKNPHEAKLLVVHHKDGNRENNNSDNISLLCYSCNSKDGQQRHPKATLNKKEEPKKYRMWISEEERKTIAQTLLVTAKKLARKGEKREAIEPLWNLFMRFRSVDVGAPRRFGAYSYWDGESYAKAVLKEIKVYEEEDAEKGS